MSYEKDPTRDDLAGGLSLTEAYLAMYYFVEAYFERGRRSDCGMVMLVSNLGPREAPNQPGVAITSDPAFWSDWIAAVQRARRDGFPPGVLI